MRPSLGWLFLLALVALGAGLGLRDPSPPDEPRFVLAAKHMVDSGNWLIPHRGSELYAHKPAPFMWSQALSYMLVGDWQWAFLLPSLLAGLGTLWLTYDLGRRLWNPRIGLIAAFALLATLQFGLQAKRAQIDMLLVLMTTLSLWGLLVHLLRGPDRRALLIGAFAAGLGTVTKGVGFLPLLVILPWLLVRRWQPPPAAASGAAVLIPLGFVAGAGIWFFPVLIAVLTRDDPDLHAYAREIFFKQTGERYANAWHHVRPVWYYLQVIATLWLPGALLLPWLLPAWRRRLARCDARQWLLLGWSLLVLLFFTASPGKREVYLFPALPAMCLAAAPLLAGLLRHKGPRRALLGYVLLLSLVLLFVALGGALELLPAVERLAERRDIRAADLTLLLAGLGVVGSAGLALVVFLRRRVGMLAVLFNVLLWALYGLLLAPALDASSSARQLMQQVEQRLPPGAELGLVAWREQMLLQAQRPAVDFGFSRPWVQQWEGALAWLSERPTDRWVLVEESALDPCIVSEQALLAGRSNRGNWWLVPGSAARAGCVPTLVADGPAEDGADD